MLSYSVVYNYGFAVTDNPQYLPYLMKHNSGIELDTFDSQYSQYPQYPQWEAYCNACTKYSAQCMKRDPYMQHIMPTFDDIIRMPYHAPDFKENIPEKRFFAAMNSNCIGVFDDVNLVMSFIMSSTTKVHVKEFDSQENAFKYISENFISFILTRSAYINGEIKYIRNIPLNRPLSIQSLIDWFWQNYQPPYAWVNFNSSQTYSLPPMQNALESPVNYPQIR